MDDLINSPVDTPLSRFGPTARGVAPLVDLQAPRQRRRPAVQLLVEIVAEPADRLRQNDSRRDRVAERGQRNSPPPAPDPRADTTERHRAPDAQAAVPDPQRPDQTGTAVAEVLVASR